MLKFEAYIQSGSARSGPIFSTSDRALAWDLAHVAQRSIEFSHGRGEVVLLLLDGDTILNDEPDWRHPDFRRPSCRLPLVETPHDTKEPTDGK